MSKLKGGYGAIVGFDINPKSAIELKSLIKSANKIGRVGEEFLYDKVPRVLS